MVLSRYIKKDIPPAIKVNKVYMIRNSHVTIVVIRVNRPVNMRAIRKVIPAALPIKGNA